MILEGETEDKEDYQVVMLAENEIPGILNMDVRYLDNQSQYYYDISGKTSFKTLHEKVSLRLEDMKRLVTDLLQVIQELKRYMLDGEHILLEPEYIYSDSEHFFFCYYPSAKQDVRKDFHTLTEFFVREVDYKDEEGVHFAYTLHKNTMEENYSIEDIMQRILPKSEKEEEEVSEAAPVDYTERIEHLTMQDSLIEERDHMWDSVRRFLERSKRRKWGYGSEDL